MPPLGEVAGGGRVGLELRVGDTGIDHPHEPPLRVLWEGGVVDPERGGVVLEVREVQVHAVVLEVFLRPEFSAEARERLFAQAARFPHGFPVGDRARATLAGADQKELGQLPVLIEGRGLVNLGRGDGAFELGRSARVVGCPILPKGRMVTM